MGMRDVMDGEIYFLRVFPLSMMRSSLGIVSGATCSNR
jgi:hypothetical protein